MDPEQTQTPEETPAPAGTEAGTTPQGETGSEPLFVARTQDELNAKFGNVREEGRLSLARKYGFETVEAMDSAMNAMKEAEDAKKDTLTRVTDENKNLKTTAKTLAEENRTLKIERAVEKEAIAQGADPSKLGDLAKLRDTAEGEIGEDGAVNTKAIKDSVKAVLSTRPFLKTGSSTVGGGGAPAGAAGTELSLDQQIATANKEGRWADAISLQMQKFVPGSGPGF